MSTIPWETDELTPRMLRCNRCGFCQDVCPTYAATRSEMDVARGRIRTLKMIHDGELDPVADKAVLEQADQCLLCGACTDNCPSSVPTHQLMQQARERILSTRGFSLFHTLVYRGLLGPQERLERLTRMGALLERGFNAKGQRRKWAQTAVARALPMVHRGLTYLPDPLDRPARTRSRVKERQNRPGRVVYFLGCGTNVFTPGAALASIQALETLGLEVSVPRFSCCGGPHLAAGDTARAQKLARRNLMQLQELNPEFIVTDCATCAHTLADYAEFFPVGHPLQDVIAALAPRVRDLNTFLRDRVCALEPAPDPNPVPPVKVTYHDPCHALRGMKVRQAPRDIIRALPGVKLVEMEGADSCCGGAGSYAFRHPEMSQKILDRKVEAIAATGAHVLATSCPSCTLQLGAGLRRAGLSIPVLNPMELICATSL